MVGCQSVGNEESDLNSVIISDTVEELKDDLYEDETDGNENDLYRDVINDKVHSYTTIYCIGGTF